MPPHANERPTQSGSAPSAGFAMRQPPAPGSGDPNGQGRDPDGQGPNGGRNGSASSGGGSGRPRPGAAVPRAAAPGQAGAPATPPAAPPPGQVPDRVPTPVSAAGTEARSLRHPQARVPAQGRTSAPTPAG